MVFSEGEREIRFYEGRTPAHLLLSVSAVPDWGRSPVRPNNIIYARERFTMPILDIQEDVKAELPRLFVLKKGAAQASNGTKVHA